MNRHSSLADTLVSTAPIGRGDDERVVKEVESACKPGSVRLAA